MAAFTKHELEKQLERSIFSGTQGVVHTNDTLKDGDREYKVEDILASIRELGYTSEQYLNLPEHKKRKVSKASRRLLRDRQKAEQRKRKELLEEANVRVASPGASGRKLRVDDYVVCDDYVARADNFNEAIRQVVEMEASEGHERKDPISDAFRLLIAAGKTWARPAEYEKNVVIYSGTGPEIEDPIVISNADDRRKMFLASEEKTKKVQPTHVSEKKFDASFRDKYNRAVGLVTTALYAGDYKLEKPQGSSLHHLAEYSKRYGEGHFYKNIQPGGSMADIQDFVVEHNWAAAFNNATDFDKGVFRLPYDNCAFEFRISGMRIIALYGQKEHSVQCLSVLIGCNEVWLMSPVGYEMHDHDPSTLKVQIINERDEDDLRDVTPQIWSNFFAVVHRQVRACSIMLEAKIAEADTVRASERLNEKREKLGRTKLRDYHVVQLNKRRRASPLPEEFASERERRSPRLHFRRGHWRHYEKHRVWIEWQLVGNEDLGFIDKEYRL